MTRPLVVLVRGLPGSGKSTLARNLSKMLVEHRVTLLDPDGVETSSIDYMGVAERLKKDGLPAEICTYRFLCEKARQGVMLGDIVIWNQPFTDRVVFKSLLGTIARFPCNSMVLVVELQVDPEIAFERINLRAASGGHGVPRQRFDQYVNDYESYADFAAPTVRMSSGHFSRSALLVLAAAIKNAICGAWIAPGVVSGSEAVTAI